MKREKFVELLKWAEERSGIKMTTPEYEVMTILFDVEHATPLEMRRQFSGSDASFFNMLKSLESKKVIVSKANPSDRRSKLYTLSARTLKILSGQ